MDVDVFAATFFLIFLCGGIIIIFYPLLDTGSIAEEHYCYNKCKENNYTEWDYHKIGNKCDCYNEVIEPISMRVILE